MRMDELETAIEVAERYGLSHAAAHYRQLRELGPEAAAVAEHAQHLYDVLTELGTHTTLAECITLAKEGFEL